MKSYLLYTILVISFVVIAGCSTEKHSVTSENIEAIRDSQTDTLVLRDSILVYPGKRIILLGGKWQKERYYSIALNSSLSFQGMFLRNPAMKNNLEYRKNPFLFEADRTVGVLYNVNEVTVIKVKKSGNKRVGYTDVAYFKAKGTKFRCNLNMALDSSEIRIDYNN